MVLHPAAVDELVGKTDSSSNVFSAFLVYLGQLDTPSAWLLLTVLGLPLYFVLLVIRTGLVKLLLGLVERDVPPFGSWFVALAFAGTPAALGAIPMVGEWAARIYSMPLEIVAIRDLAQISTKRAVLYWLGSYLLLMALVFITILFLVVAAVVNGLRP